MILSPLLGIAKSHFTFLRLATCKLEKKLIQQISFMSRMRDFLDGLESKFMRKWTNRSPDQVSSTFLRSFRSDDVSHSFLGWGYDGRVGPYLGGIIGNRTLRLHSFSRDLAPRSRANFNVYGCIEEVSTLR